MWYFLARNRHIAVMLGVLVGVAILVVYLGTRGIKHTAAESTLEETEDISDEAHIFTTDVLPSNARFMPSIGNGHLAATVFSDTIYMNGLYNGRAGRSHRARIPNWANLRLNSTLTEHKNPPLYILDTKEGVFKVTVEGERSVVTQRVYAHKYYTRSIVNQIQVVAKPHDPNFVHMEIWIALKLAPGEMSTDISFHTPHPEVIEGRTIWHTCGQTMESEDLEYQPLPVGVCVYWTSVPDHVVVPQHGSRVFTFVLTADKNETVARQELIKGNRDAGSKFQSLAVRTMNESAKRLEDGEELFDKHLDQWQQVYKQGKMEIDGNLHLAKVVNGIWYYMLSSLPAERSHHQLDKFYGLSPVGLASGGTFEDYEGHNFWDTETWMFPTILLLYPKYARALLQYRLDNAHVAAALAKLTGHKGYRFPWESAYTGTEVTQPCCPKVAEFEQHIGGCISFAARQYLATTRDEDWLKHGGCSLVTHIADFWASRAVINYSTGLYDIDNVMGPDEGHPDVKNSAFTNVVAGYSLYLAQYVSCLCKSYYLAADPAHYADIAWSLALPYDKELDYHPQFDGYQRGEAVKQADVVLLGFPLQYAMNISTRANDLSYYGSVTKPEGPAMTWSMHTVGHLQLEQDEQARAAFNESYLGYVREPFKVWTELARPEVGAANFFTGMGGFLQTLVFGYAGVSIRLDSLQISRPQLPPGTTRFKIQGIKYLGSFLTLEIGQNSTTLKVSAIDDSWPLTMYNGKYNVTLVPGMTVTLTGDGPFPIRSSRWKDCKLPADRIGNNYLRPIDT